MFFSAWNPDDVAAPTAALTYVTGLSVLSVADGSPDDGDAVTGLTDAGGVADASQGTAGSRPVWKPAVFPGRGAIRCTDTDHLLATPPAAVAAMLVIVKPASGTRGLVARDTSATTDKPAWKLTVEETFG